MAATAERRAAERGGRRAEWLAAWYLRAKGYRILARRYRTPAGEIDLIVQRGRAVAFVEVKRRVEVATAFGAVTATSRRRIVRAAALWLQGHPAAAGFDQRFDVVICRPGRVPQHIISAFDAEGRSW